jgi:hypothetical protein
MPSRERKKKPRFQTRRPQITLESRNKILPFDLNTLIGDYGKLKPFVPPKNEENTLESAQETWNKYKLWAKEWGLLSEWEEELKIVNTIEEKLDDSTVLWLQGGKEEQQALSDEIAVQKFRNVVIVSRITEDNTLFEMFLSGNDHLENVTFVLPDVQYIMHEIMNNCINLKRVSLNGIPKLKNISDSFMFSCKELIHISFSGLNDIEYIASEFLFNCESLKRLEMKDMPKLLIIGDESLSSCKSLENISLSGMSSLFKIGVDFARFCTSLTEISFGKLPSLSMIDFNMLDSCTSLENVYLEEMPSVHSIKGGVMKNCTNLKTVSIDGMSSLQIIGSSFLEGCKNLESLSSRRVSKIEVVEEGFLFRVERRKVILDEWKKERSRYRLKPKKQQKQRPNDFGPFVPPKNKEDTLENAQEMWDKYINWSKDWKILSEWEEKMGDVTTIESVTEKSAVIWVPTNYKDLNELSIKVDELQLKEVVFVSKTRDVLPTSFLSNNNYLVNVSFVLPNIKEISNSLLLVCENLDYVSFNGMSSLEIIGKNLMGRCEDLRFATFTGPDSIIFIGDDFMDGCINLEEIHLDEMPKLAEIGNRVFQDCKSLIEFEIKNAVSLVRIGAFFLVDCEDLEKVSFSEMPSLTSFDIGMLQGCKNLVTISFTKMHSLVVIGRNAFYGCINLRNVFLDGMVSLKLIEDGFLWECSKIQTLSAVGVGKVNMTTKTLTLHEEVVNREAIVDKWEKERKHFEK